MHASIAHHFAAIGALISDRCFWMAWTEQRTIRQNHRWRRPWHIELGNRNLGVSRFHEKFYLSEAQSLACAQLSSFVLGYWFAAQEGPVGGAAVAHGNTIAGQVHFAVES